MVRKGVVPFEYKGERGTRVGLLRSDFVNGERTQWFTLPSFMAFHVVRARPHHQRPCACACT